MITAELMEATLFAASPEIADTGSLSVFFHLKPTITADMCREQQQNWVVLGSGPDCVTFGSKYMLFYCVLASRHFQAGPVPHCGIALLQPKFAVILTSPSTIYLLSVPHCPEF